jgi:hypothetical protein
MKMKSKFDWVRNRANEDINKLLLVYACKQKELAILSVDMQNIFLDYIYPNFKREILEIYHKEIKTVCKKNDILFKEIKFKVRDKKVNSEDKKYWEDPDVFEKDKGDINGSSDLVNGKKIFSYLEKKEIKNLYIIGVHRDNCILGIIKNFFELEKYKIFTSFLGTGTVLNAYLQYKNKIFIGEMQLGIVKIFKKNDINNFSFESFISLLKKFQVIILDAQKKDIKKISKHFLKKGERERKKIKKILRESLR